MRSHSRNKPFDTLEDSMNAKEFSCVSLFSLACMFSLCLSQRPIIFQIYVKGELLAVPPAVA